MRVGFQNSVHMLIKIAKNLTTLAVMGVPIWLVVAGLFHEDSSTLRVVVEEPNVLVWVGDRSYHALRREVEPIELKPGVYPVRVTRGSETLFAEQVELEAGAHEEVRARWGSGQPRVGAGAQPERNEGSPSLGAGWRGTSRPSPGSDSAAMASVSFRSGRTTSSRSGTSPRTASSTRSRRIMGSSRAWSCSATASGS
jgi:hypothetical protein